MTPEQYNRRILRVEIDHNGLTSFLVEYRACGCVIRWGFRNYFDWDQCERCRADWERPRRGEPSLWKPWTWFN